MTIKAENFQQNVRDGAYRNTLPYPQKKDFECSKKKLHALELSEREGIITKEEAAKKRIQFESAEAGYREAVNAYNAENVRLHELFKQHMYEYHDVEENPKREKAFSLAWEYGHSSGHSEVASHFEDLVELIVEEI